MENAVLKAFERNESGRKCRQAGYMPGVVYANNMETKSIKFLAKDLISALQEKGQRTKINLEFNGERQLAIIKEVGRNVVTGEIIHIDLQVVKEDQIIKRAIPVEYTGKGMLKSQGLYLQVYIPNVEVVGETRNIPDVIRVDVSDKKPGHKIRIADLDLKEGLRAVKNPSITLGSVSRL